MHIFRLKLLIFPKLSYIKIIVMNLGYWKDLIPVQDS